MEKVRDKNTGEIALANFSDPNAGAGVIVYTLPAHDYEIMGRVIARYKTRKGFWKRWEVQK